MYWLAGGGDTVVLSLLLVSSIQHSSFIMTTWWACRTGITHWIGSTWGFPAEGLRWPWSTRGGYGEGWAPAAGTSAPAI